MMGNNHKTLCMTSSDVFSLQFCFVLHGLTHSRDRGLKKKCLFLLVLDSGLDLEVMKSKTVGMPGSFYYLQLSICPDGSLSFPSP